MITLKKFFDRLFCRDSYQLRDGVIHRKKYPFREEALPIDEIATWTMHPEMIFQVVEVRRKGGEDLIWFDYNGDLKSILRMACPAAEKERT